jgi:hypothetical protein
VGKVKFGTCAFSVHFFTLNSAAACGQRHGVGIEWSGIDSRRPPGGVARQGGSNEDHDPLLAVHFHL